MTKGKLAKLEPQQRLLLAMLWEYTENGGQNSRRGSNIGWYVGASGVYWLKLSTKDTQHLDTHRINGAGDYVIQNRIS